MRYNWVRVWLSAIDRDELRDLVVGSWRMTVPKKVWREYLASPHDPSAACAGNSGPEPASPPV